MDCAPSSMSVHASTEVTPGPHSTRRWAAAFAMRTPRLERGPYLTLSSSRGSVGLSGLDTLLRPAAVADPPAGAGARAGWNIETEIGYGFPFPDGSTTGTPWVGITLAEGKPEYRLLFDSGLHLSLAGAFRDRLSPNEPPHYLIMLLLSLR